MRGSGSWSSSRHLATSGATERRNQPGPVRAGSSEQQSLRNLAAPMAQRVGLQSVRPISELRCPPATELMWPPPPKDRHPVAPELKGHSAAFHYCRHRSAPRESCRTRNLGKAPNQNASFRSPNVVVSIESTVLATRHRPRGVGHRTRRPTESTSAGSPL